MTDIFMSVGRTSTHEQEALVEEVEAYLRDLGLNPSTVGRNYFKNQQPLVSVSELMAVCSGAVILAFERVLIKDGLERRGDPDGEQEIRDRALPTVWNQIEAAMAYSKGLPLLVLVEEGMREEGLLDQGFNWFPGRVSVGSSIRANRNLVGLISDWKQRVDHFVKQGASTGGEMRVGELTPRQIVSGLSWVDLLAVGAVCLTVLSGFYYLGTIHWFGP
ncbi:MAG: hypothetical protein M3Y72_08170 [Acidobacteriota bacterium]|nr:hypothetical protein [Acidobacteriota bacterium]